MNIKNIFDDMLIKSHYEDTFIKSNRYMIKREEELHHLEYMLRNNENHVVLISGYAGMGKSTLARMYAEANRDRYEKIYLWYSWELPKHLSVEENSLIIVDDADDLKPDKLEEIVMCNAQSFILVLGRNINHFLDKGKYAYFSVSGLKLDEMCSLFIKKMENLHVDIKFEEIKKVSLMTHGNPAILECMIGLIDNLGIDAIDKLLYEHVSIGKSEIVLPNKNIISAPLMSIKKDVLQINDSLMRYIAEEPMSMHELSSREFEIIIAELFEKLGYEVELTKQTRDGGVDIYIAEKTNIGKFLFLVECKHYASNRPVGIEVIRNMYGVLGMNKRKPTGGIIATTSHFAKGVKEEIIELNLEHRISLHDFEYISELLKKAYL
ncbi:MAG: restriction endonuclease [Lachnospiraceae bacterium]|nr:restriction endonuclease [Lachnospiraceae bacterium]